MELAPKLLRFALFHFLGELRQDGQRIADDAQVGNREDRRVLIFIDGDDVFGTFHAREMLDSAADADGHVERGLDGLARLPDLVAVGQPTGIDDCARRASRTAQRRRKFFDQVVVLGFAQAATTAHDYAGIFKRGAFALYINALEYLDYLRTGLQRNVERLDFGSFALEAFQRESFGACQDNACALPGQDRKSV